ncbi:MAG: VWA domain-containing protein [Alphaproteobacteria bacterium]|nr:VWA domain-containing protein [Alphaproteobacteria bacterium]
MSERLRRWRLALGGEKEDAGLSERDQRLDRALASLYDVPAQGVGGGKKGGLGASAPRIARWLGDIREFFPASVVQVIQKDAFDRLGLKQMLLEPEFLAAAEADVHLVADLVALRNVMPNKSKAIARQVIEKVVRELMAKLEKRTVETIRGAVKRGPRTNRPRFTDIDWDRTIRANLKHWQPTYSTLAPERLVGRSRRSQRANLHRVILCVDQSGSMATSVVYASIFSAVLASVPSLSTKLITFDTVVLDLSDQLADPVDVLFGVQLGGGTDINQALAYCERYVEEPHKTQLILISDLFEGGDAARMLARAQALVSAGVNVIALLALSDDGRPGYDGKHAGAFAAMGCPVFACTPDQFPELMAAALKRQDLGHWAAERDIALVRPEN